MNSYNHHIYSQDNPQDNPHVNAQVNAQVRARVRARVNSILNANGSNTDKTRRVLKSIEQQSLTRQAILSELGLLNHYKSYLAYVSPLMEKGFIEFTASQKRSRNQQYKITLQGMILLKILELNWQKKT